ncbi:hypothetical protein T265_11352 [Opisthorchis viverrini]|uniref:Uncharacterized protein n=1 Tax=Opisthorchis viverrini TaxID=6198 RepID=A0A074YZA2_OPIVI|nr:hypothetical protein T265_11352 [Opisthorchis viverrini]KER20003.1 hypothetical protein T265_11352 [Opisthorchis viverrini]
MPQGATGDPGDDGTLSEIYRNIKMSTDGCVRFCDSYVFLCPPSKPQYVELGWCNERPQTMLTADYEQCLAAGDVVVRDGNGVTASTCIQPVARSVFQIFSPKALPDDCVVTYGIPIQFRLANTNIGPERVYLASDNASPMSANRMSGHQRVFLTTDKDSFLTHWKIEHQNPDLRMESEGCPVKVSSAEFAALLLFEDYFSLSIIECPSDTLVLIKHCRTNAAIAVEDRFTKNLSFGQEYEVSCHTYLDGHRAEKDVNLFSLATIIPPNNS